MKKNLLECTKIKILVLFFVMIPFIGCKEEEEGDVITYYSTYIEGFIKDNNTGAPVQGVVIDASYIPKGDGGWSYSYAYKAYNVAVSDQNGYYKVKIPRHGVWKNTTKFDLDFDAIELYLRDVEHYNFTNGQFVYNTYNLKTQNKRIDIKPITHGYLKVTLPKTSNSNSWFWEENQTTFEYPRFQARFVSQGNYNDTLKYLFYKVIVGTSSFGIGNFQNISRQITINNALDTAYINVEQ